MTAKEATIKTLKGIGWVLMIPPRTIRFVWKHKLISMLTAIGLYWGAGELKTAAYRSARQERQTQTAPKEKAQSTTVTNTPTAEQKLQKAPQQPSLEAMELAALQAVSQKSFISADSPAENRIQSFVEQGSKNSSYPDKKGVHTIIICDQTNVQNYAAIHIGFHHNSNRGMGKFLLYRSCTKPENGTMPAVNGPFNVSFDVPGVRMGVSLENNTVKLIKCQENVTTLPVSKDNGQTLLLVTPEGNLQHITDTNVIQTVFQNLPTNQKAPVMRQEFNAYHDEGAYPKEAPQWQLDLMKNNKSH